MIQCNENCTPCCDFCIHVIHEELGVYLDGSNIMYGGPISCKLHEDKRHQDIVQSLGACNDFYCINAQKPNKWIEVDICDS